ncbi:MAG: SDR family NAD(P)-dependent oxidoreductase [Patescibacteria group bacterium]
MVWKNIPVVVTGGASFIGSHLVDALVAKGAKVLVVDDLSTGRLENIKTHLAHHTITFLKGDLTVAAVASAAVKNRDYVFHLAAIHGGRGVVDTHQAVFAKNTLMDTLLIQEAHKARIKKFIFASSGCIYPNYLQKNPQQKLYLTEEMAGPPYDPDNMYGWAKLTTEIILRAYARDYKMASVSCRFFTVYGERGVENHGVVALIAKAFIRQDPYEVWGDGNQVRNWTYVGDIVSGMIAAAETVSDGSAVNLGTMERIKVIDAVKQIFAYTNFHPKIHLQPDMPTGPLNRVCDNSRSRRLLGWQPKVKFKEGLARTINWYFATKDRKKVAKNLRQWLTERI